MAFYLKDYKKYIYLAMNNQTKVSNMVGKKLWEKLRFLWFEQQYSFFFLNETEKEISKIQGGVCLNWATDPFPLSGFQIYNECLYGGSI